jgi:SpoVK/Ycf46/Vps4 family AAA+-type ATPase
MDGIEKRGEIIVIGEKNSIDEIDKELRRNGSFDSEL